MTSTSDRPLTAAPPPLSEPSAWHEVSCRVNGHPVVAQVESRLLLSDFLRHRLRLTGTHVGCEQGSCGACTVIVDGVTVRSCLVLAVAVDEAEIVRGWPATASCTRRSRPSTKSTLCSAASARQAC
jgi:hypothetical protein